MLEKLKNQKSSLDPVHEEPLIDILKQSIRKDPDILSKSLDVQSLKQYFDDTVRSMKSDIVYNKQLEERIDNIYDEQKSHEKMHKLERIERDKIRIDDIERMRSSFQRKTDKIDDKIDARNEKYNAKFTEINRNYNKLKNYVDTIKPLVEFTRKTNLFLQNNFIL
jgi:predicted HNH restriction endonuclease